MKAMNKNTVEGLMAVGYLVVISIVAFVLYAIKNVDMSAYTYKSTIIYFVVTVAALFILMKVSKCTVRLLYFKEQKGIEIALILAMLLGITLAIVLGGGKITAEALVLLLVVAIGEETIFRGYAYPVLKGFTGKVVAALICSIFAALIQLLIAPNQMPVSVMVVVNYWSISLLGQLFFQKLYDLSQSLVYPVAIHFLLALAVVFLTQP